MARIRSLHPTQWTDEEFVSCSPLARLLALGLRNEADDNGVFEWKPITLKMRLLPVDNIDMNDLLSELEASGQVRKFEAGGKSYGAIRNFRKFQSPKKPNSIYPVPSDLRTFLGLDGKSSEPDTTNDTTSSEPNTSSSGVSSEPTTTLNGSGSEPVENSESVKGGTVPKKSELGAQMEGRGEEKEGKGSKKSTTSKKTTARDPAPQPPPQKPPSERDECFLAAREILTDDDPGPLVGKLLKVMRPPDVLAVLNTASRKQEPWQYLWGVYRKQANERDQRGGKRSVGQAAFDHITGGGS